MNGDMDYTTVRCTTTDRILTVTLNRPDHLNAFTRPPEYHGAPGPWTAASDARRRDRSCP
jgi:hypothetical protein